MLSSGTEIVVSKNAVQIATAQTVTRMADVHMVARTILKQETIVTRLAPVSSQTAGHVG